MPYINPHYRNRKPQVAPDSAELAYHVLKLMEHYTQHNGDFAKTVSDCIGAVETAKLEYMRRTGSDTLDEKKRIYGDI